MPHVVISTFGSLGDVYPYIAIGRELRELGVDVTIATSNEHRDTILINGIQHAHVGPDIEDVAKSAPELMSKVMDRNKGSEYVLREIIMGNLKRSYEDVYAATETADLILTHTISYAALVAARVRKLPFISSILSPLNHWSAHDPPVMPEAMWIPTLRSAFGPGLTGLVMQQMKNYIYPWAEPYRALQAELGLDVDKRNVFFEGMYSPVKHLALFSPVFGPPQPDWPPNTVATGFCYLEDEFIMEDKRVFVRDFLQSGDPPVVFTLGSSAVWHAGDFYVQAVEALKKLNLRGVLLVGPAPDTVVPSDLPDSIIAVDYLPHSLIFRHASAVVHQGGVGTTAQALRSGRPQLILPWSHDQFDNAARVKRLGCGLTAERTKFTDGGAQRLVSELVSTRYRAAAHAVAKQMEDENGAVRAAQEIFACLKA